MEEEKLQSIIETLTEKIYSHGHAIGRKEAKDIGLPLEPADGNIETLMWALYLEYESFLKLNDPIDPEIELGDKENITFKDCPMAVIESAEKLHLFRAHIQMGKNRQIPPSPQININLNLNLPPNITPDQLPENAQQILQNLNLQLSQQIPQQVQAEIEKQSPIVGIGAKIYGGKWHTEK
jgi:hypothetical protein